MKTSVLLCLTLAASVIATPLAKGRENAKSGDGGDHEGSHNGNGAGHGPNRGGNNDGHDGDGGNPRSRFCINPNADFSEWLIQLLIKITY
jgi:hypothetical protein